MTQTEPAKKTFPYLRDKGPRTPPPADKPGHYRLSKATWKIILREYIEGATATELSSKYRVSMHAIRKQITKAGATKAEWGDRQVMEQAAAREAEIEAARAGTPEARAARLFDVIEGEDPEMWDPAVLGKMATLAAGRAMTGRLWAEAKALTGLAESFGRLTVRQDKAMVTLDDVPLALVAAIAVGPQDDWIGRMGLIGKEDDPENPIRDWFWARKAQRDFRERDERYRFRDSGIREGRKAAFREMGMVDPKGED